MARTSVRQNMSLSVAAWGRERLLAMTGSDANGPSPMNEAAIACLLLNERPLLS
jgi:hypothetical protein